MNAEERELLHRHLNGDLDGPEQARFMARLQESAELRRALAAQALDETLLSELVLEGRTAQRSAPRRRPWIPATIAAAMLIALTLVLSLGRVRESSLRVTSFEGTVALLRDGRSEPLFVGQDLRWGDRLSSSAGGAVLERKGLRLELGPDSAFELQRMKGMGFLSAEKGILRARVSSDQSQLLKLPLGTFETKEATFRIDAGPRRTRVDVEQGSVEIDDGRTVRAGQSLSRTGAGEFEIGRLVSRSAVDAAVQKACRFLESRRSDLVTPMVSEKRHGSAPRRTYAELALLALHRAGVPDSNPLKADLLGLVMGRTFESTYAAALQAVALAEIDPAAHHVRLRECAQILADSQCANGQWDYAAKVVGGGAPSSGRIRRRAEGPASGDNSVTSYAILALHACAQVGVEVETSILDRARAWLLRCQNADGGWGYNDSGDRSLNEGDKRSNTSNASYGSATASALASLWAIVDLRGGAFSGDSGISRGLDWLAVNFVVDRNPGKTPGFAHLHWLIAAERAGDLLGTERFGAHEWYAEGAGFLLQVQRPTGDWRVEQGEFMASEKNDVLDTCLAILFLRRAP